MNTPKPLSAPFLFTPRSSTAYTISPDDSKLLWWGADHDGVGCFFLRHSTPDESQPIPLQTIYPLTGHAPVEYVWAYTNEHILYLHNEHANERWQLMVLNLTTGETTQLTPGGTTITYKISLSPHAPTEIVYHLSERSPHTYDLYKSSLITGERLLLAENDGTILEWYIDTVLKPRGFLRALTDGTGDYEITIDTHRIHLPFDANYSSGALGFSPDSRSFYYVSAAQHTHGELFVLDTATGTHTRLATDNRYDLGYQTLAVLMPMLFPRTQLLFSPSTGTLEAFLSDKEKRVWTALTKPTHPLIEHLTGPTDYTLLVTSMSTRRAVIRRESPLVAPEYYLVSWAEHTGSPDTLLDTHSFGIELLASTNPALQQEQLSPTRLVTIPARDGLRLNAYVTLPVGKSKAPLIIVIHGGPWARDLGTYSPQTLFLTSRGYGVLSLNFRGSAGFGKAFMNEGNKQWGKKMCDDIVDAYLWAEKNGIVAEKKCALFGRSYGGFASLNGILNHPDLFACAIADVAVTDVYYQVAHKPAIWEPHTSVLERRMGDPVADEALLREISPLTHAGSFKRPLFISHGAHDARVDFSQFTAFRDALKRDNPALPVVALAFPNDGHRHATSRSALAHYEALDEFLKTFFPIP